MLWGVDNNTHDIVGTKYDLKTLKKGNEELENWLRHKLSDNVNSEFHYVCCKGVKVGVLFGHKCGSGSSVCADARPRNAAHLTRGVAA